MPQKITEVNSMLQQSLDGCISSFKANDSVGLNAAYDMLYAAFEKWVADPENKKQIFEMMKGNVDENTRFSARVDFGQKEDKTVWIVLIVEYDDKVAWKTFPYDDFEDTVQDALDDPLTRMTDSAIVSDSIRAIRSNRWMDKILVIRNGFTSIWDDCKCRYRDSE